MWIFILVIAILNLFKSCNGFCWTANCQSATQTPTKSPVEGLTVTPIQLSVAPSTVPSIGLTIAESSTSVSPTETPSATVQIQEATEIPTGDAATDTPTSRPSTALLPVISTLAPSSTPSERQTEAVTERITYAPSEIVAESTLQPTTATTERPSKGATQQDPVQIQAAATEHPSTTEITQLTSSSSLSPTATDQVIVETETETETAGALPIEFKPKYTAGPYKFAIVVKSMSAFFDNAFSGCLEGASNLPGEVECQLHGPVKDDAQAQSQIVFELVNNQTVQGIAISVSDAQMLNGAISYAIQAGVPVITFDSDAPQSQRLSYIGTNNFALGEQLAKVLLQLDPTGYQNGKFGLVSTNGPNLVERMKGFRNKMRSYDAYKMPWKEVQYSPTDCEDQTAIALQQMYQYADDPEIRAIIPLGGWPMWNDTEWKKFVNTYRSRPSPLKLVVADSIPIQIDLLSKGYVNGLVGQLPYQMGQFSVKELWDINEGKGVSQVIFGTNLLQVLRVPLILPEFSIEMNFIGNIRWLGYFSSAVIAIFAIGFAIMSVVHRETRVIRASQPFFLVMICVGTLILGFTIIPASIDNEFYSMRQCSIACMCTPWLLVIGFTTIFSALFSKTWRINQVIRNASKFKRVKVTVKDVMLPFVIIMLSNFIVLISWTVISPLQYKRSPDPGTDAWNRVIETYGVCNSKHSVIFGSILFSIAVVLLIISNIQAYQARSIRTEFSESKFISITVAAILQAMVVGAPVLLLSQTQPVTSYVVLCLLIFVTCTSVLFLIMAPKAKTLLGLSAPPPKPQNRWSNASNVIPNLSTVEPSKGGNGLKIDKITNLQIKFTKSSMN